MARKEADAASRRVAESRSRYDDRLRAVALAEAAVNAAAANEAKNDAHRRFRATVAAARERGQVEAAAIDWLESINRINNQARLAQTAAQREREAAQASLAELTELSNLAASSETMAVEAMAACEAARAALAARPTEGETGESVATEAQASSVPEPTEPHDASVAAAPVPAVPATRPALDPVLSSSPPEAPADEEAQRTDWLVIDLRSPEPQVVIRLMRRESTTLGALVDRLAGGDVTAASCWRLLLSTFVDAVTAAAIDDAALEFAEANPFWNQFTQAEAREVARGLAALGFRFDGFASFADGRVPSQRDLALAVGAAGLLPARVKYWPGTAEAADLFRGVRTAGDTFIAAGAPALTLGELVRLLGRRAEPLADLWNDWSRIRPLLFETRL